MACIKKSGDEEQTHETEAGQTATLEKERSVIHQDRRHEDPEDPNYKQLLTGLFFFFVILNCPPIGGCM